ncbi:hypothetical protein P5673_009708 [Acropora cervicornis]|uniref:Uncharacterized protein n=1 Tax=Acropora cervicornis TaxID=6130 RepID=A0AAD9V9V0_ACRCE|nr:hypothetical protein P5673_009708 [Acropora cervicornis]
MASRNRGKMCFWSNDVNRPLVRENYLVRVRKQKNPKGNERGTVRLRYSFSPRDNEFTVKEVINKMNELRQKYKMEKEKSRKSGNGTAKKKKN